MEITPRSRMGAGAAVFYQALAAEPSGIHCPRAWRGRSHAGLRSRLLWGTLVGVFCSLFLASEGHAQSTAATTIAGKASTAQAGSSAAPQTYVQWIVHSSGVIGLFILGLAIYFVVAVVRLSADLRLERAAPPDELARCRELVETCDLRGVFAVVRESESYFCRMLKIGLMELPHGLAEARDAMERHGEAETVEMEKRISMLAVLGTLGPMIGLIGTLKGMIASFSVIAMSDVQLKASEVAGGISEALLLTFEGVALSVPAIYFFTVFRNRVSSISVATMLQADGLLRQFDHAARRGVTTDGTTSRTARPTASTAA